MKFDVYSKPNHPLLDILTPKAGLFCAIVLIIGTILNHSLVGTGIFFISSIIIALWGGSIKSILSILIPINIFMVIIWITLPLSVYDPIPILIFQGFPISLAGIKLALLLTLKTNATALFFLSFVTNNPHELGRTLQSLNIPNKLIVLFILFYQHVCLLHKDIISALHGLSLRAPKLKGIPKLKAYAYLVGTLLVHNIDHANNIRMALLQKKSPLMYAVSSYIKLTYKDILICFFILLVTIWITYYFNRGT